MTMKSTETSPQRNGSGDVGRGDGGLPSMRRVALEDNDNERTDTKDDGHPTNSPSSQISSESVLAIKATEGAQPTNNDENDKVAKECSSLKESPREDDDEEDEADENSVKDADIDWAPKHRHDRRRRRGGRRSKRHVRQDLVDRARHFLGHPTIRDVSLSDKITYLESRGLTRQEIDDLVWEQSADGSLDDDDDGTLAPQDHFEDEEDFHHRNRRRRRRSLPVEDDYYEAGRGDQNENDRSSRRREVSAERYPSSRRTTAPGEYHRGLPSPHSNHFGSFPHQPYHGGDAHRNGFSNAMQPMETHQPPESFIVPMTVGGFLVTVGMAFWRWLDGGDFVLFPPPTVSDEPAADVDPQDGKAEDDGNSEDRNEVAAEGAVGEAAGADASNARAAPALATRNPDDVTESGGSEMARQLASEVVEKCVVHSVVHSPPPTSADRRVVFAGDDCTSARKYVGEDKNTVSGEGDNAALVREIENLTRAIHRYHDLRERTHKAAMERDGRDITNSAMGLLRQNPAPPSFAIQEQQPRNKDVERDSSLVSQSTSVSDNHKWTVALQLAEVKHEVASLRDEMRHVVARIEAQQRSGLENDDTEQSNDSNDGGGMLDQSPILELRRLEARFEDVVSVTKRIESMILNAEGSAEINCKSKTPQAGVSKTQERLFPDATEASGFGASSRSGRGLIDHHCANHDSVAEEIGSGGGTLDLSPTTQSTDPVSMTPAPIPPVVSTPQTSGFVASTDDKWSDIGSCGDVSFVGSQKALSAAIRKLAESGGNDPSDVKSCSQMLYLYMLNLSANPTLDRYRKIQVTGSSFKNKVANVKGGRDVLIAVGFVDQGAYLEWRPDLVRPKDQEIPEKSAMDRAIILVKEATAALSVLKVGGNKGSAANDKGPTALPSYTSALRAPSPLNFSRLETPPPPPCSEESSSSLEDGTIFQTPKAREALIVSPPTTKKRSDFPHGFAAAAPDGDGSIAPPLSRVNDRGVSNELGLIEGSARAQHTPVTAKFPLPRVPVKGAVAEFSGTLSTPYSTNRKSIMSATVEEHPVGSLEGSMEGSPGDNPGENEGEDDDDDSKSAASFLFRPEGSFQPFVRQKMEPLEGVGGGIGGGDSLITREEGDPQHLISYRPPRDSTVRLDLSNSDLLDYDDDDEEEGTGPRQNLDQRHPQDDEDDNDQHSSLEIGSMSSPLNVTSLSAASDVTAVPNGVCLDNKENTQSDKIKI